MNIGEKVKETLKKQKRTQKWLSDELGIDVKTISRKLGNNSIGADELIAISVLLDINLNEFKDDLKMEMTGSKQAAENSSVIKELELLYKHPLCQEGIRTPSPSNKERECVNLALNYLTLHLNCDSGLLNENRIAAFNDIANGVAKIDMSKIKSVFDYTYEAISKDLKTYRRIHLPMILYIGELAQDKDIKATDFGDRLNRFFDALDDEFLSTCQASSAKKCNVQKRMASMRKIID